MAAALAHTGSRRERGEEQVTRWSVVRREAAHAYRQATCLPDVELREQHDPRLRVGKSA